MNDLAPHATEFLLRVCEPSDLYRYANGHRSVFYNESPLPCDPVTQNPLQIFSLGLETRLSVFVFFDRLSHPIMPLLKGEDSPQWLLWYAASVNTRQVQLSVGVFHVIRVTHVTPPPAATLPLPTNPARTPTELVPPDDDSVDCSGSRLMSAAARFAQGAAGGM